MCWDPRRLRLRLGVPAKLTRMCSAVSVQCHCCVLDAMSLGIVSATATALVVIPRLGHRCGRFGCWLPSSAVATLGAFDCSRLAARCPTEASSSLLYSTLQQSTVHYSTDMTLLFRLFQNSLMPKSP